MTNPAFHRLQLITGDPGLDLLHRTKVIVFGIGGVGSWCAEALARSGIGQLTIVDSDVVCVTNINRQVQATSLTVGKIKTEELARRLSEINPHASIRAIQSVYDRHTADSFALHEYDYVVDAIDSLSSKVELIIRASEAGARVLTALGASNKLDPTRIKVSSLWDSEHCPLGRFVRKRLRRRGFRNEVTCVYSDENVPLKQTASQCGSGNCVCPKTAVGPDGEWAPAHEWCSKKKQINGSVVHITGTFGFFLSGLIVQDVLSRAEESNARQEGEHTHS